MVASIGGLRSRQRCSHRDFSWSAGQETHLLREEVYTVLREDNDLEKTVTRHTRDPQAISSPDGTASESALLPYTVVGSANQDVLISKM